MDYSHFEEDFIRRTLLIIEQYEDLAKHCILPEQRYETTLLINCLLGLLVLPHKRLHDRVPAIPIGNLTNWGVEDWEVNWGDKPAEPGKEPSHTLDELVRHMRNGAAHVRIAPQSKGTEIAKLQFTDRSGFSTVIPVASLKTFVKHLAAVIVPGE